MRVAGLCVGAENHAQCNVTFCTGTSQREWQQLWQRNKKKREGEEVGLLFFSAYQKNRLPTAVCIRTLVHPSKEHIRTRFLAPPPLQLYLVDNVRDSMLTAA